MKNFNTKTTGTLTVRTLCLFTFLFFFSAFTKSTHESVNFKSSSESTMSLSGYSNLNNWSIGFNTLNSKGNFTLIDGQLDAINALEFDIFTTMGKGENTAVDSVLHTLLTSGEARKISFKLTRQMVLPIMKMVHLVGDFTIAGETRPISLHMSYEIDHNKNIKFSGTNTILISGFANTATMAKLKGLKCNDQLTFKLELNLQSKS